jgi:thiosulfate dehydrogenase
MEDLMYTKTFLACTTLISIVAILPFTLGSANADEEPAMSSVWDIARGGQLYDKWYAVLAKQPPEETHPSYPAEGKQTGAGTWRCKECHGWDYRGNRGAYGSGSHFTGIRGIREMVGVNVADIVGILGDDTHQYTDEMIPPAEKEKLAKFVSLGQIDMDLYVDRTTKTSRGDPAHGATYYQTICAVCHGFDGKALNFHDSDDPEYVGTIAKANPWEFMHKARFGQPGIPMISLIALPIEDIADLLAYSHTLPEK